MENRDSFLEQQKAIEEQKTDQEQLARKKTANKLCTISLILQLAGILLFILRLTFDADNQIFNSELLGYPVTVVACSAYYASWVLMIIARVRFKKSVFAKILMWVYIGIVVLIILAIIAFIAWCMTACSGIPG